MNKELLKKVRDAIAKEETYFDQEHWWLDDEKDVFLLGDIIVSNKQNPGGFRFCGTPCCIAGHAIYEFGVENIAEQQFPNICGLGETAQSILGLTPEETEKMFRTDAVWDKTLGTGRTPTREEALQMLDTAIEYDRVEWPERNTQ